MSRLPIEVAIDEACGFAGVPDELKQEAVYDAPEDYIIAYQAVVEAAMRWSERGVPLGESQALADALQVACDRLRELESK